jgi:Na+/H+ antiporter NhaD/arsenite permease-like protein
MSVSGGLALAVFAIAYGLIATERLHRVAAALGGAAVMLVIGATDAEHAFFSEEAGIDWNVIFLLLGMMLIVAVLQRTVVFEYLAIWAAKRAGGRPFRVMVILVMVTAIASALLDNVTTVLLVAPVTFVACRRLGVPVAPYLIAQALASNIGGTATLVGDPPNIVIASGPVCLTTTSWSTWRHWLWCCWWFSWRSAGGFSVRPSPTTPTAPRASPRCGNAMPSATCGYSWSASSCLPW